MNVSSLSDLISVHVNGVTSRHVNLKQIRPDVHNYVILAVGVHSCQQKLSMAAGTVQELREGCALVTFETIGTLHQCSLFEEKDETDLGEALSATLQWEVLEYGLPVVIANENGVVLCLADIESGDKLCEFTITSSSKYIATDKDFHVIATSSGCYGISFKDGAVGEKIMVLLNRVLPSVKTEENHEPIGEDKNDGGGDEVDGLFHSRWGKRKAPIEISDPENFQHLTHIGAQTSISQFTYSLNWTDTLKRKERIVSQVFSSSIPMYNYKEVDTISTTSFVEAHAAGIPPPPPPPAPPPPPSVAPPPAKIVFKKKTSSTSVSDSKQLMSSLADELKKGVVLRPVSGDETSQKSYNSVQEELKSGFTLRSTQTNRALTLPMRPRRNENEKLLFEIKTFRRKKLHHISKSDMTDFPTDEKSLESVLKKGLSSMSEKLCVLGITNVASVNRNGEGDFDGLFIC